MVMIAKAINDAEVDGDGSVPLEPMRTLSDLAWGGCFTFLYILGMFSFRFVFSYFGVFILVCLMFSRVVYCFEKNKNTKIRSDEYNIMLPCAP